MKTTKIALAAAATLGLTAASAMSAPTEVWQATGLAGPECALPDPAAGIIYVSNVNGDPMGKDAKGYIAKVSMDGKKVEKWVDGLKAPKGLAVSNGKMYVGDVDELVEIDIAAGKILAKHKAPGAGLLNDVAADAAGNVYVSDTGGGGVFKLSGGKIEKWADDKILAGANGLLVEGDNLIVNTWGILTGNGFETSAPGRVVSIALADKKITEIDGGKPVGNLDGFVSLGGGNYIISDWMAGKIFKFSTGGKTEPLIDLGQGNADIGYDPATKIMYVPQMMKGTLHAIQLQ
jgi:DNA-binding beta-propeller fold protein YncE